MIIHLSRVLCTGCTQQAGATQQSLGFGQPDSCMATSKQHSAEKEKGETKKKKEKLDLESCIAIYTAKVPCSQTFSYMLDAVSSSITNQPYLINERCSKLHDVFFFFESKELHHTATVRSSPGVKSIPAPGRPGAFFGLLRH